MLRGGVAVKLGKIEKVDLRSVWKNEAYDFTPWLAKPENIENINDIIGLSLTDVRTEESVGSYSCDIVAKDEITNKTVIIENQLEATDHDHLGKIITYASGLNAAVIIWVVKEARPEESNAIEWLNEHTDEDISFFLLEIKLLKIGDSEPAPQFEIVEQPNDFEKNIKKANYGNVKDRPSQIGRLEFWASFNEVMAERKEFGIRKATTDHWYDFALGSVDYHLTCDLLNKEHRIRVNFYIPNDPGKEIFDGLLNHKDEIEKEIGKHLEWQRLDGKKAARICTYIEGLDFNNHDNYKALASAMIDELVKFRTAFTKVLR